MNCLFLLAIYSVQNDQSNIPVYFVLIIQTLNFLWLRLHICMESVNKVAIKCGLQRPVENFNIDKANWSWHIRASDSPATYGALQMCFDLIWFDISLISNNSNCLFGVRVDLNLNILLWPQIMLQYNKHAGSSKLQHQGELRNSKF